MEEKSLNSIENRANLNFVRYANCWEDADILLKGLNPKKGSNYLSIASAGDNSLSLLVQNPNLVLAVDINPTQLACVELKKAAFKHLTYEEVIKFLGLSEMRNRKEIYQSIKSCLSDESTFFWDTHIHLIEKGIIHIGKFENYFRLFRTYCLPLIHSRKTIRCLLEKKTPEERRVFYSKKWNNFRWKLLFKFFFSKKVMGLLGRDPEFFKYVKTDVANKILSRVEHGLSILPSEDNAYLEYILKGNFQSAFPHYLRKENFENIQRNIDKLTPFKGTLQEALAAYPAIKFDGFNLSDIFEYMSHDEYERELGNILRAANHSCRIAFWNMLAERKKVSSILQNKIDFLDDEAATLLKEDKAFFYQSFIVGVAR